MSSECAGCSQHGHASSKTLHQQNPPVLNWRCWLMQVDLYNGHKMVVVVVVVVTYHMLTCSQLGLLGMMQSRDRASLQ